MMQEEQLTDPIERPTPEQDEQQIIDEVKEPQPQDPDADDLP